MTSFVTQTNIWRQDTEFPGVVARPMGAFRGKSDYHYQTLRTNVDLLKLIQIGITLFTEDGETTPARPQSQDSGIDMNMPGGRKYNGNITLPCTWQFNFKFSLKDDMYSQASIDALLAAGVDFTVIEKDGIDPFDFGALLISSGMVCDEDVRWISFHGGYDFGYLCKLMLCKPLPDDEREFEFYMQKFFPAVYDVKFLMKHAVKLYGSGAMTPSDNAIMDILQKFEAKAGLEYLAELLKIKRIGPAHQGGSDSLLTGKIFFAMRERFYQGEIGDEYLNMVWGLGMPEVAIAFNNSQQNNFQENNTPNHNGYTNGGPSTPNNKPSTPATGIGAMTPGGGGGVFGQFHFGK